MTDPDPSCQCNTESNFLGLPCHDTNYDQARFAVLPIPYDATVCFQTGSRCGPQAIISASSQLEFFDEELLAETYKAGITTMAPVEANIVGPAAMHEDVFKAAKIPLQDGKFLMGFGGEHGITSGLVRATALHHDCFSVLQIDAHLDLRDEYLGTKYSHASVMRRCLEIPQVDNVVPVGNRNMAIDEYEFVRKNKIRVYTAPECDGSEEWIISVLEQLNDKVYVTVDIDGFDPGLAPGTGTPEPGGLQWYPVVALLRRIAIEKTIVGADIVEVMPIAGQAVTEFLAAKLAYRLMGYVSAKEHGRLAE